MKIKKISVHAYDNHLVRPIDDLAEFGDLRQKLVDLAFSNRDECLKGLYNLDFKTATSADLVRAENIAFIFDGTASIVNPIAVRAVGVCVAYDLVILNEQIISARVSDYLDELKSHTETQIYQRLIDFYQENKHLPDMFQPMPKIEDLNIEHTQLLYVVDYLLRSVARIHFREFVSNVQKDGAYSSEKRVYCGKE